MFKHALVEGTILLSAVAYAASMSSSIDASTSNLARHEAGAVAVADVDAEAFGLDYSLLGEAVEAPKPPASAEPTPAPTPTAPAVEEKKEPTYLIYFTATWCGPCQVIKPTIEEIKREGKYEVRIVDIDREPQVAANWGVKVVPTTAVVYNGKLVHRQTGPVNKAFLKSKLEGK